MTDAGFRVTGRVQGVGFRWWTRAQATRLGLAGTVRNAPDGTVEVHVRGEDAALAELERLLEEGPPPADVRSVLRIPAAVPEAQRSFELLR
jgi:acylphosphatase